MRRYPHPPAVCGGKAIEPTGARRGARIAVSVDLLTGVDGKTDPDRLRDAIAVATDRLLEDFVAISAEHQASGIRN
jgi:hypothetical protein